MPQPKKHVYYIDIVGTCNLRCPSCPTGNFRKEDFSGDVKPLGFMTLEKFDAIIAKILKDRAGEGADISLFNWGDPLLHPKVPEFISRVTKHSQLKCYLSSNLSLKVDLDSVIASNPHWMRISLSGFYQETYAKTHRRGDIELVKANMRALRRAMDRHQSKMTAIVCYHVYRHNAGEDFEAMQAFAQELGFVFEPIWAQFYPLEKLIPGKFSEEDRKTIDLLAIKPDELRGAALAHRDEPCQLQTGQTSINYDGTVQLCCATFEPKLIVHRDFLAAGADDLLRRKQEHAYCTACLEGGYHAMMVYRGVDTVADRGNARIAEQGAKFRLVRGKVTRDASELIP